MSHRSARSQASQRSKNKSYVRQKSQDSEVLGGELPSRRPVAESEKTPGQSAPQSNASSRRSTPIKSRVMETSQTDMNDTPNKEENTNVNNQGNGNDNEMSDPEFTSENEDVRGASPQQSRDTKELKEEKDQPSNDD